MIPRQSNRHAVVCCGAILFASMVAGCSNGDDRYESIEAELLPTSVRIDSVSTGRAYTRVALATGIQYYTDRTFRVGSFSSALNGGVLIKTADADAYVTRAIHLRFTSSTASTVYVAMDRRTNRLPAWLDSTWRLTNEVFATTGDHRNSTPMRLYAKSFGASVQVTLGGNMQSPARGMDSNYVVIVVGATGSGTGGAGGAGGTGGAATGGAATGGAATGGAATGGAATGGAAGGAGGTPVPVSLYAVAHPDDDLLFINPDIESEIQAHRRVRTIFTTSGDGGEPTPTLWMQREANIKNAYAAMAGAANSWSCATATYSGKPATRCALAGTLVDLIFIRLPDGRVRELLRSTAPLTTIDGVTTFTRAQMLATLAAIQSEVNPTRVGTLDATLAYGYEHDDHIATAIFTFDTARADGVPRQLTMYRGYTVDEGYTPPAVEPANLTSAQHTEKARIFTIYNWNEQPGPTDLYDRWCWRFYPVRNVTGGPGQLHSVGGLCLAASAAADGSPLQTGACSATPSQIWTASSSRVTASDGRCIGLAADGTTAVVEPCTGATDQSWTLLDNGQLRGAGETCLTAAGGGVSSVECDSDTSTSDYNPPSSQRWTF